MAQIIRHRDWGVWIRREHRFDVVGDGGCGYSFDVDVNGKLININENAIKNYNACTTTGKSMHGEAVIDRGIKESKYEVMEPAILECNCGNHIELDGDECCDKCGQWYNSSGQALRHPSQWGEETGEYFDDHGHYIGGGDD